MTVSHVREALAGVHYITLPLPWELETVNVYLVRLDAGFLLIDSGMGTEDCFESLQKGLSSLGVVWPEIRVMVITHVHPDHVGLGGRLLELSGAELWMHRHEIEYLNLYADPARSAPWRRKSLTLAGVPDDLQQHMNHQIAGMRESFQKLHPARLVSGGETLPTAIGQIEVLWTPGHSPGHICLLQRDRRLLFSGDQILESVTPNISWQPDQDALGDYLQSLRFLAQLDIDLVLPAHGSPFSGHREWIDRILAHHQERCARICRSIADRPKTAHEITEQLWPRPLSPLHHHFAALEVLAHLEHMKRNGQVRSQQSNGALRFS